MKGKVNTFHVARVVDAAQAQHGSVLDLNNEVLLQCHCLKPQSFTTVPSVILVDCCSDHVCQNKQKLSEGKTTNITEIHPETPNLSKFEKILRFDWYHKVNGRITQEIMRYGDMLAYVIIYIISQRECILCPVLPLRVFHTVPLKPLLTKQASH